MLRFRSSFYVCLSIYLQCIKVIFHHGDVWIRKSTRRTTIQQYPNIAFLHNGSIYNVSHWRKGFSRLHNGKENPPMMLYKYSEPQNPLKSHQSNYRYGQGPAITSSKLENISWQRKANWIVFLSSFQKKKSVFLSTYSINMRKKTLQTSTFHATTI